MIQAFDRCWDKDHRLDARICHLGLRRAETCWTCHSGYEYTVGFSRESENRAVTSTVRNKVDTIPKASSIRWYMDPTDLLFWTLTINFHFPYWPLNHLYLHQWPERNWPTLHINMKTFAVTDSWKQPDPFVSTFKSWDCAKEGGKKTLRKRKNELPVFSCYTGF